MRESIGNVGEISRRVLGFVNFLRRADFNVGPAEVALIGRAFLAQKKFEKEVAENMLRALCCQSEDEWRRFGSLFQDYWFPGEDREVRADPIEAERGKSAGGGLLGLGGSVDNPDLHDSETSPGGGAARQTIISRADFRFLGDQRAMRHVERLAEQIVRHIPHTRQRRREPGRRRGQLAIRPTLRRSIRFGGMPLQPVYSRKRRAPPKIVVLHDVSHSMTFNNPLLFRFTRGLVRRFRSVEAFVFHTRLFRVTPMYREASLQRMREHLEARNHLWLGGTCIADSLAEFRTCFSHQILNPRSLVIIISDACDSNAPEELARELVALSKKCKRIFWLNPMLEREGVDPFSPALKNIRKHVDKLLPAHSLNALYRLAMAIKT